MEKDTQRTWAATTGPAVTGLMVTATTMATAVPGLSWLDAGDFVTATKTLGVPHPTGFPLYTIIGHALAHLPVGNIASRVALLSSLAMGWSCFCLVLLVVRHSPSRWGTLAAGAVLTLLTVGSPIVFISARVPEVYGLHCALVASALVCLDSLWVSGDQRWGYLLSLVIGFGLCNHALFRILSFIFVLFLILYRPRLHFRFAVTFALLVFASLLTYLYLPVAASGEPAHNWGDPSSFKRFWDHISGASIRAAYREEMTPSLFRIGVHLKQYMGQLWSSLGPLLAIGVIALGASLASFARCSRQNGLIRLGILFALLIVAETVYAVAINPMGLKDLQNGQFSILGLGLAGAVSSVIALRKAARLAPRLRYPLGATGIALLLGSPVSSMPHDYLDIVKDWTAEDIAVVHTSHAAPESMTVLVSDSAIAAHLYAQVVLDARPDMAIFGRNQVAAGERFAYVARRQPYPLVAETLLSKWEKTHGIISKETFEERMHQLVEAHEGTRAIYWEETVLLGDLSDKYTTTHTWPIGQLRRSDSQTADLLCGDPDWSFCTDHVEKHLFQRESSSGAPSRYYRHWLAENSALRGKRLVAQGNFRAAADVFAGASELAPDIAAWKTNMAVCLASMGEVRQALDLTLMALEQNPLSQVAVKNALLYARKLGDQKRIARLEQHARQLR